jgi:hypothetical protein
MRKLLITTAASLLIGAAPAIGQSTSPAQQQPGKPAKDPNEVVCEKQEVIGSRLASQKVCKTRAEWAEQRRQDRMDVDKVQTLRGTNSPQ